MRRLILRLPHSWRAPTFAALAVTAAGSLAAQPVAPPDIVLLGGKLFTADPRSPWAEALAVRGGRIIAVGTTAEVERIVGPATIRIVLGGRTVVPGFDDAHAHAGVAGVSGVRVTVEPSPTPDPAFADVLDSLTAAARRTPAGVWLYTPVGGRVFDDPRSTRAVLDSVAPEHPVWVGGWACRPRL